jgi:hypothetical protein
MKDGFRRSSSLSLFSALVLAALALAGCAERKPTSTLHANLQTTHASTVLAVYEAWFGEPDHINVGYSSHDPAVLYRQIEQAKAHNIGGFVVDWYGLKKPFIDESFARMEAAAQQQQFKVALMYDELVNTPTSTDEAISDFEYAYQRYIGPNAPARGAYLRYEGRPVIFIWPNSDRIDWTQVRLHLNQWPDPPVLIYKEMPTPYLSAFDGVYVWINPGRRGWQPDGSNWGHDYLQYFYTRTAAKYPGKLIVGTAWPGFDDHRARWTEHRYMAYRCGRTFQDTLDLYRDFVRANDSSPFLLIATWNDYEEGTAIEEGMANPSATKKPRGESCS